MRELNVRGTVYNYPDSGEDLGTWGSEASDWAEAVTDTLDLLIGANDILQTSFLVENNIVADELVRGLYFNPADVRAANVTYSVYRQTDSTSVVEAGELLINYNGNAAPGQKWQVIQRTNGNAGIILTIDDLGQFYYQTTNIAGTNYTGVMKFLGKSLST